MVGRRSLLELCRETVLFNFNSIRRWLFFQQWSSEALSLSLPKEERMLRSHKNTDTTLVMYGESHF